MKRNQRFAQDLHVENHDPTQEKMSQHLHSTLNLRTDIYPANKRNLNLPRFLHKQNTKEQRSVDIQTPSRKIVGPPEAY